MSKIEKFKQWTSDGWNNVLTGLGRIAKDKRMSAQAQYLRLTEVEVEELYACDDMAEKIVDTLPEDMMREGFKLNVKDEDETISESLIGMMEEKAAFAKIEQGLSLGRLYGGAGTIIGVNDGGSPEEPVNEENIVSIDYLNTVNRYELYVLKIQNNPEMKNFGEPEMYRLQPILGGKSIDIHRSRVMIWHGARLPRRMEVENNYWSDSVLNRVENALRNFHSSHDSVASTMQDFAQAVFKLKGLSEMISQGQDGLVQKRLAMVDAMRSVTKAIVIEDDEEFERKVTALTGIPEVLDRVDGRVVQAAKMPKTLLLGDSPSGLNADGSGELRNWYDFVSRQQEKQLKPELEMLVRYYLKAAEGPTKGVEPEGWLIKFNPLWQMSDKEVVEIRERQANTDEKYILNQVLDPQEVRTSRFGGQEFSLETKIEDLGPIEPPRTTTTDQPGE